MVNVTVLILMDHFDFYGYLLKVQDSLNYSEGICDKKKGV